MGIYEQMNFRRRGFFVLVSGLVFVFFFFSEVFVWVLVGFQQPERMIPPPPSPARKPFSIDKGPYTTALGFVLLGCQQTLNPALRIGQT